MTAMKKSIISVFIICPFVFSCDLLDTKYDMDITTDMVESDYTKVAQIGQSVYAYVKSGLWELDGNLAAARSDEAVQTTPGLTVSLYNNGSWDDLTNPENYLYDEFYKGIRNANYFLEYSVNYKELLRVNRDTISDGGTEYRRDIDNIRWMRAEARVARAYYYFELQKRWGGVPLITETLEENEFVPKSGYDRITDYIVTEIDESLDSLRLTWNSYGNVEGDKTRDGRFTTGAALALKSRALLYAASPLNNPENDREKWKDAANAAYEVIALNQYSLDNSYGNLFIGAAALSSPEIIMAYRHSPENTQEKNNYPIGTPGGNSGITPSENLVSAYEYAGTPDPSDRYANLDPRFYETIVYNGSEWNGRIIDMSASGQDSYLNNQASKTGYYLKKFLAPNLYLQQDDMERHLWPIFRYAEILLNYAEAMNEAFGPDGLNGKALSAKDALNMVRQRPGVNMPPVTTSDKDEFRTAVRHERQIELAFEGHRYWDLIRWEEGDALAADITGVRVANDSAPYIYDEITVEQRVFTAPKMYRYPFPYYEVQRSGGVLEQNPGW